MSNAGSEIKIRELCRGVEELDLACNQLHDINEIYKVAKSMPNLRFINLSENDLSKCSIDPLEKHNKHKITSIKSLVLNNTKVPWYAVHAMLDSMPCIEDLHLSLNNYTSIDVNSRQRYPNVKYLYLTGNPELQCWKEIQKLMGTFPNLEGLTMADCNINVIPQDLINHFPKIQSLNISNWPITSWDCLERLNQLPNLVKLRCQGIQLLNELETAECRRHHLIARLHNIKRLNGSEISDDERVFAEKAFLRWYVTNKDIEKPKRSVFQM